MKRRGRTLLPSYRVALCRHIEQGTAASLQPAQRLGRRAVVLGSEALDLAQIHEQALVSVLEALPIASCAAQARIVRRAGMFFAEAIVPMEATHLTALDANRRLSELNQTLSRRTHELSASNRSLTREIVRRRAAEKSLRKSEQHSILLLEQSRHLQEQLRFLSRRVLSTQEDERRRISRELHDVVAQLLTGINVRLAALKTGALSNTKGLNQKISRTQRLVEKSVDIVHRFARELRPAVLDDLGLIPAVHSFLKGFTKETGIRVSLTASAGVERLSSAKRTTLYRIVQEALTNVVRHAQAGRVDVSIRKLPRAVRVQIKDDGKGFEVDRMWRERQSRHLGMLGMRERVEMVGGRFTVESAPGQGVAIQAQVPFDNGAKEPARP
jgi:signal transduction histidine kinase